MHNEIISKLVDAHLCSLASRLEEYAKQASNFVASQLRAESRQLRDLNESLRELK